MAIGGGRVLRTATGSPPRHPSVFFHMPKCGGTSLSEAMYATVPMQQRIGVIDAVSTRRAAAIRAFGRDDPRACHEDFDEGWRVFDLRETLMLQHMAWDTMLIHGHVLWSEAAHAHFGDRYRYVTLLREPLARTISNLRMAQRAGLVDDDLEAYLESSVARRHARVYLRYLAGRNDIAEDAVAEATGEAIARLDGFALVGFLDRQPAFLAGYRETFGVPLRLQRLNAAPDGAPPYPDRVLARLRELCAPDLAIHEAALSHTAAAR